VDNEPSITWRGDIDKQLLLSLTCQLMDGPRRLSRGASSHMRPPRRRNIATRITGRPWRICSRAEAEPPLNNSPDRLQGRAKRAGGGQGGREGVHVGTGSLSDCQGYGGGLGADVVKMNTQEGH